MYQRSTRSRYPLSDGGDSGPSKYRMSTTVSGPFTPVVRRTIPSGSRNRGVPSCGLPHPFTQSSALGPRVGGGSSGRAGGVTEGIALDGGVGETGGGGIVVLGEARVPPTPSPVHATSASAVVSASTRDRD